MEIDQRDLPREPDEERDIIVHFVREYFVPSSERRDSWMVWLGQDKKADYPSKEEAVKLALKLAAQAKRPAWLHEGPYPPKLIYAPDPR
jgi:hypothetical protein